MAEKKYIDAEAFREDYHRVLDNDADWDMARVIDDFVYSAPAADVREVKHGRWLDAFSFEFPFRADEKAQGFHTATCSVCRISQSVNVYQGKVSFLWCPYCGAMMDGGNEAFDTDDDHLDGEMLDMQAEAMWDAEKESGWGE